jgi:hypothetical protein
MTGRIDNQLVYSLFCLVVAYRAGLWECRRRARNLVGVSPYSFLNSRTKLLTSRPPLLKTTSFMLRKDDPNRVAALFMRRCLRYCMGERPVSCLKSWRRRAGERFTFRDKERTETLSVGKSWIIPIAAFTRTSMLVASRLDDKRVGGINVPPCSKSAIGNCCRGLFTAWTLQFALGHANGCTVPPSPGQYLPHS